LVQLFDEVLHAASAYPEVGSTTEFACPNLGIKAQVITLLWIICIGRSIDSPGDLDVIEDA